MNIYEALPLPENRDGDFVCVKCFTAFDCRRGNWTLSADYGYGLKCPKCKSEFYRDITIGVDKKQNL